jgi:dTMP kinase
VVCDRFLDSTLAYQGYGLGIDINTIKCIGGFATQGIKPDLTIFLDLPVKAGLRYRHGIKDRIEKRSFAYHSRVRNGYLSLAAKEPGRIKVVKIQKDKRATQADIQRIADNFLTRS